MKVRSYMAVLVVACVAVGALMWHQQNTAHSSSSTDTRRAPQNEPHKRKRRSAMPTAMFCSSLPREYCGTNTSFVSASTQCAWSVDRGCFKADFETQVWLQASGCHGGLVNQRRGMEHLLRVIRGTIVRLPPGKSLVLVLPPVWTALFPPFPPSQNGSVASHEPYSTLFDAVALQQFLRSDKVLRSSGERPPIVAVERAPQWLAVRPQYEDSEQLRASDALRYPESVSIPCANVDGTDYDDFVGAIPAALVSAAEAGEGVKLACLHVCNRKGEGWEFRDAALMDATRPSPRLLAIGSKLAHAVVARGGSTKYGAVHLRLEADMCDAATRLYVTPTFQPTADAMCRFTPQLIEQCLLHIGLMSLGDTVYVASGNEYLRSKAVAEWKAASQVKVVTKLDVACSEHPEFEHCIDLSGLGREELAAVEMSVLFGARYFAGAHASALSSIVYFFHRYNGRPARLYTKPDTCGDYLGFTTATSEEAEAEL